MCSKEIIELLIEDGWFEIGCNGSHHQFKHPAKPGRVTVPHPKASLPKGASSSRPVSSSDNPVPATEPNT